MGPAKSINRSPISVAPLDRIVKSEAIRRVKQPEDMEIGRHRRTSSTRSLKHG